MLRKILSLFAGALGAANSSSPKQVTLDPGSILYTVPTLSNETAEIEPASTEPNRDAVAFHEDDWCQVEFMRRTQIGEIKRMLTEYKHFEKENRTEYGWKNVYVRDIRKDVLVSGKQSVAQLGSLLGAKQGSALYLESTGGFGKVKSGFTIPLGGNINLYGTVGEAGITVLAAVVGQNPDNSKLTDAFASLNKEYGLILVDWKSQMILLSRGESGKIEVWKP